MSILKQQGHSMLTNRDQAGFSLHDLRRSLLAASSIVSVLLGLWLWSGGKSFDHAIATTVSAGSAELPTSRWKTVAIREIQPAGYKVLADNPQTPGQAAGDFGEFDPKTWQVHRFLMDKPDGGWLKIGLARPMVWIESVERNDSGQIWLEFEELGIADWATLQATEPCPTDILGEGRLVTGTFEHSSGDVLNLFIAGEASPIGSTANHPFWSEDRQDFVQAGSLAPGEHLRLADGRTTTLERAEPIAEQLPVYNLEVDGEHVYYVGESAVLVHNAHRYRDSIDVHVAMSKPSQKHLLNLPQRPGKAPKFNQMNNDIHSGHAPRTIERIDKGGGVTGEQPHVHLNDGNALNIDGTWKHGNGRMLTRAETDWLTSHFWPLP